MNGDPAEVLVAAERRAAALVRRDAEALRALHHPELAWTTHTGAVFDRDGYVRANTERGLHWRKQSLEDTRVTVVGDAAVLTGVVVDEVEQDGAATVNRLRLTQIWARDGHGWRCLAGHAGPRVT